MYFQDKNLFVFVFLFCFVAVGNCGSVIFFLFWFAASTMVLVVGAHHAQFSARYFRMQCIYLLTHKRTHVNNKTN